MALAWAIPAAGTQVGPFSSESCHQVYGYTYSAQGPGSMRSYTAAYHPVDTVCNWSYVSAYYWQAGQYNPYGPGWIYFQLADTGTQWNVNDATATHSGCHAGGPCGTAVYKNTYD